MWIVLSVWARNLKIFVFRMNAHQRVTSAGEDFNNQVGRMICSVYTSDPLSRDTPVITQKAHEQSGQGGRDGGHGLSHMDFYSPRLSWLWPQLSTQPASS